MVLFGLVSLFNGSNEKSGSELLHANYAARTNFQNNTTLQLAPTPLNSMSALRSQNNTTLQLVPTPLNSMSALRSQNNTPLPRQFGLFIASSPHMQITTTRI